MSNIATLKGLRCPHCGSEQLAVTGTKGAMGGAIATSLAFGAIGNLVAGSSAAANQATEPLQYKCENCNNKFETMPFLASQEDVLESPCMITFTREANFVGAAVPQILYINGVKIGAVKNGKSITFATGNRYNVMFVTDQYGVAFKSEYRFEALPGSSVSVRFNRRFLDVQGFPASNHNEVGVPGNAPGIAAAVFGQPKVCFCVNCGGPFPDGAMFCPMCGEKRFSPPIAAAEMPTSAIQQPLHEHPERSLWFSGILALSWIALLLLQGIFQKRLMFGPDVAYFLVAALMGAGVYQLIQKGIKYKLFGVASGLVAAFLSAGTFVEVMYSNRTAGAFYIFKALNYGGQYFWGDFGHFLLFLVLTFGAAVLAGYLLRKKPKKRKTLAVGGVAAGVYFLSALIAWIVQNQRTLSRITAPSLFSVIFGMLADAIILYFAVAFIQSLCRPQQKRVQLFGAGKAWAWIAVIGMFLSIFITIGIAYRAVGGTAYTASLLLAFAGTVGYILLLCKRRIGLYVLVGAAVLVLGGQFAGSLTGMMYSASYYTSLFLASMIGTINPLLAWLAVRSADRRG